MGTGIAQVVATAGHRVFVYDNNPDALSRAETRLREIFRMLNAKGKVSEAEGRQILGRIHFVRTLYEFEDAELVIEAIVEDLPVKKAVFEQLEDIVEPSCILATNTSSLSIASIAASCQRPERVLGIHFFNPAPLMRLVEIIPAVQTAPATVEKSRQLIQSWGKVTVQAKDTPGFIVNRVARPFYGEALRIVEEGIADPATVDWAMTELGGFRMGPFALMDYIGNDVNYQVTRSVFEAFYYDPRYKPSFLQRRLVEAGYLGRKSGRGFFDYAQGAAPPEPVKDPELGEQIVWRIVVMLINEAADARYLDVASLEDLELAMTKGVNYPRGLLAWADAAGISHCVETMDRLHDEYREDRYRCSPLLRRMAREGKTFF